MGGRRCSVLYCIVLCIVIVLLFGSVDCLCCTMYYVIICNLCAYSVIYSSSCVWSTILYEQLYDRLSLDIIDMIRSGIVVTLAAQFQVAHHSIAEAPSYWAGCTYYRFIGRNKAAYRSKTWGDGAQSTEYPSGVGGSGWGN